MARGLCERIFDHAIERGWIVPGQSVVLDPFGGIGSTGIIGASNNVQVVMVELEKKFVNLAKANIKLHRRMWKVFEDPIPVMLQGDSRRLTTILRGRVLDAVIASPPYAGSLRGDGSQKETAAESRAKRRTAGGSLGQSQRTAGYGSPGNLGNLPGETFWSAAAMILKEVHQILKPEGICIWVTQRYVRKGKIVPFPHHWLTLCEACGFEFVEWIKASKVKEQRHPSLFGGEAVKRKDRKGFYRRLYEKEHPDLAIDWEDIVVVKKPA